MMIINRKEYAGDPVMGEKALFLLSKVGRGCGRWCWHLCLENLPNQSTQCAGGLGFAAG